MKKTLMQYYTAFRETKRDIKRRKNPAFRASQEEANVIRLLHIIEKGLSLENPRLGFGEAKIEKMFAHIAEYKKTGAEDKTCLYMARDAIRSYLEFHKEKGYTSEWIDRLSAKLADLEKDLPENGELFGGVISLNEEDRNYSVDEIEKLFNTRHSVREFSGEPVADEDIRKAIELASRCPSACNRQCARVYSIDAKKYLEDIGSNLEGIGGFADQADKFLLITSKTSAYSEGERHQHIVSSAIFAGYLTLTLQLYDIAACSVQRSVSLDPRWNKFAEKHNVPGDEQIVMMLAVGKFKPKTTVPVSKRFSVEKIYKKL